MLFDIHVHTKISPCSDLDIAGVLKHAKACGLDGVCITDHQTMEIRRHLREGIQDDGLCVVFGIEYATAHGDFLLFGPFENISLDLSAIELLNQVRHAGGVAIAAHPFRSDRPVSEHLVREGFCRVVESVNGRNTPIENLQAEKWRKELSLTCCGGSDAHSLDELGTVGTRFSIPVRSRNDLIFAFKNGLCHPECSTSNNLVEVRANV
ncbi:MAG: PHP domain-containing protein [Desulfobacterales bacterium]